MADRTLPARRIAGLSEARRLPRIAKLRLGVKVQGAKSEYPKEVSYFVSKEEDFQRPELFKAFRKIYKEKPTQIEILFPVEDPEAFFPQEFKKYGGGGLRCRGNGIEFTRIDKDTGEVSEGECPSPDSCEFAWNGNRCECKAVGNLLVILPLVTWSGVVQIDTSSKHGIIGINSAIDYYRAFNGGRIAGIPFHLRRVEREIQYGGKKSKHYVLELAFVEDPKARAQITEKATAVRSMISVFDVEGASPKEIEGDLYAADVRRRALSGGATDSAPGGPPPAAPPPPPPVDEPPPEVVDVETAKVCPNCEAVLPPDPTVFRGSEFCSEKCALADAERLARISTEEEIAEDADLPSEPSARRAPPPPPEGDSEPRTKLF